LRKHLITAALVPLSLAVANADTLTINYQNGKEAVTVHDTSPAMDFRVHENSFNTTLDVAGMDYVLPRTFCDDLIDQIKVPTSYDVTVQAVYDAQAWIISNFGNGTLTQAQDAGMQLAIWDLTYTGITYTNVSGQDGKLADDPTLWEAIYLAADNYGANKADGFFLVPTTAYGQKMIIAPPPGFTNGLPGPAAMAPFFIGLLGILRRRKRRV